MFRCCCCCPTNKQTSRSTPTSPRPPPGPPRPTPTRPTREETRPTRPPRITHRSMAVSQDTSNETINTQDVMLVSDPKSDKEKFTIPYYVAKLGHDDGGYGIRSISGSNLPMGIRLHGGEKLREDGLTGKGIRVGVIDEGIDIDHTGFGGMVKQRQWWHDDGVITHGTHVAGTIHMMAPEAEIYDYRALGGRTGGYAQKIAEAIETAISDGCQIINMSLGSKKINHVVYRAVRNAYAQGVIMFAACGNKGDTDPHTNEIDYPAYHEQCISIAAVRKEEGAPIAVFRNGRASQSNDQVDYSGIGVDVKSFAVGGGYLVLEGTSMATPHVCGLVAALMTKGGKFDGTITDDTTCRQVLNDSFCIDIGASGRDNQTGLGFATYLSNDEFRDAFRNL